LAEPARLCRLTYRSRLGFGCISGLQTHNNNRPSVYLVGMIAKQQARLHVLVGGIQQTLPPFAGLLYRQAEENRFVVSVEHKKKRVSDHRLSALVDFAQSIPIQQDAQTSRNGVAPCLVRHFVAPRFIPGDIFDVGPADAASLEKFPST